MLRAKEAPSITFPPVSVEQFCSPAQLLSHSCLLDYNIEVLVNLSTPVSVNLSVLAFRSLDGDISISTFTQGCSVSPFAQYTLASFMLLLVRLSTTLLTDLLVQR